MKKIGLFTTFSNLDRAYSLCSVVYDQLVAHVAHGYEPVLFTLPQFEGDVPKGVEVRKIVPQIILEPYKGTSYPETWRDDVGKIVAAVKEHATDIDIMITHDIVFIDTYIPYNVALREAELPCKFLHWIHSAPSPRKLDSLQTDNPHRNRYLLPPRSKLVYLNNDKTVAVAEMYGTFMKNVRVIYNSRDPRTFWNLDPFVEKLINKYDLLSADIISVYPVSTPRMMDGKQLNVVIKIHEHLKKLGLKTKLIVPNAHANAMAERESVNLLANQDIIFTSREGEEYVHGVSSRVVSDLFRLSNVFIFPSISENCSLILLEAMLAGNLLVLNKDCSGFQEFGKENAIYFKMGNLDMGTRNFENALKDENYYRDMALIIRSEWEISKPLQAKRRALQVFNYDSIFEKIESIYYEQ